MQAINLENNPLKKWRETAFDTGSGLNIIDNAGATIASII